MASKTIRRVLVLGASGMLGNAVLRVFVESSGYTTVGSARSYAAVAALPEKLRNAVICGIDVENCDSLLRLFSDFQPDVIINCVGVVKQLDNADDPMVAIPLNALLPHRLARLAMTRGARLVHISTDCVFSGKKGMYTELDFADAQDLYGRSKHLGEVDYTNAVTLRTSIIGHELASAHGLISWFLAQSGSVRGFKRAIFSGLPTVVLGTVIRDYVLPNEQLRGVYHVSAPPISKYELLNLVAKVYAHKILIEPDEEVVIDRSLDSSRFKDATAYATPSWPQLIKAMHEFR